MSDGFSFSRPGRSHSGSGQDHIAVRKAVDPAWKASTARALISVSAGQVLCVRLSISDRESPRLTVRSGTPRARWVARWLILPPCEGSSR